MVNGCKKPNLFNEMFKPNMFNKICLIKSFIVIEFI